MKLRALIAFLLGVAFECYVFVVNPDPIPQTIVRIVLLAVLLWQFGLGRTWAKWTLSVLLLVGIAIMQKTFLTLLLEVGYFGRHSFISTVLLALSWD